MMKKILSSLMAVTVLVSVLSGCSASEVARKFYKIDNNEADSTEATEDTTQAALKSFIGGVYSENEDLVEGDQYSEDTTDATESEEDYYDDPNLVKVDGSEDTIGSTPNGANNSVVNDVHNDKINNSHTNNHVANDESADLPDIIYDSTTVPTQDEASVYEDRSVTGNSSGNTNSSSSSGSSSGAGSKVTVVTGTVGKNDTTTSVQKSGNSSTTKTNSDSGWTNAY